MLKIKVETELSTHEPTADVGFVTWWTITVTRDPLGEEGAEIAVGSVRAATIHYGEVVDVAESLYDVLDADSGELEALSSVFFEDDWLRDEFEAAGNGLFYVAEIDMPDVWRQRGADLAIVHRLSCTLAMGCSLLVLEPDEWSRKDQWGRMGFMPSNGDAGAFQFLNLTLDQPRSSRLQEMIGSRFSDRATFPTSRTWTERRDASAATSRSIEPRCPRQPQRSDGIATAAAAIATRRRSAKHR